MDSILADLGVETRTEEQSASDALRQKVLGQIVYGSNPLLVPSIPSQGIPNLTSESLLKLSERLRKDAGLDTHGNTLPENPENDNGNDAASLVKVLKYRFLESLLQSHSSTSTDLDARRKIATSSVVAQTRVKVKTKLADHSVVRTLTAAEHPQHLLSNNFTHRGRRFSSTGNAEPMTVHTTLRERKSLTIDDSMIDAITKEAAGPTAPPSVEEEEKSRRIEQEKDLLSSFDAIGSTVLLDEDTDTAVIEQELNTAQSMSGGEEEEEERFPIRRGQGKTIRLDLSGMSRDDDSDVEEPLRRRTRKSSKSKNSSSSGDRETDKTTKKRKKKREMGSKSRSTRNSSGTVQCPLCSDALSIPKHTDADEFLAAHMAACRGPTRGASRRQAATSATEVMSSMRQSTSVGLGSSDESEDSEVSGDSEMGDRYVPEKRGKGGKASRRRHDDDDDDDDDDDEEGETELVFDSDDMEIATQGVHKPKKNNRLTKVSSRAGDGHATGKNGSVSSRLQQNGSSRAMTTSPDFANPFLGDAGMEEEEEVVIENERERVAVKEEEEENFADNPQLEVDDDWEDEEYAARLDEVGISDGNNEEMMLTDYGAAIPKKTWDVLHDYQKEGCAWLFNLFRQGIGGILGDEMGLGKTVQLCTHFHSLACVNQEQQNNRRNRGNRVQNSTNRAIFLIVCPATVLCHWLRELHKWVPSLRVLLLHSISKTARDLATMGEAGIEFALRRLQKNGNDRGLVVVTSYEGLRKYKKSLVLIEWTSVCLDEGQKIRNPHANITEVCKVLPAFHRLILSGTPIQNNLTELWSLLDFCYPGRLGTLKAFETEFAAPIRAGGYVGAGRMKVDIAVRIATTLQNIVRPILLRRRKTDVQVATSLPKKTEQVLFCSLSSRQRDIYRDILASPEIEAVLLKKTLAFRAITTLRKLCNHPGLVYKDGKVMWHDESKNKGKDAKKDKNGNSKKGSTEMDDDKGDDFDVLEIEALQRNELTWQDSGKLLVLNKVLPLWKNEGHKVLLFSQTQSMLNMLEGMMREFGFSFLRLDGSTPIAQRESIIYRYNNDKHIFVMLLTTRTGGVGISLTAANRVVLIDPDWNPQTDVQARERAWRLGQKREVTIYRLITRGTIEEKIYQRQIFKLLLSNRILDNPNQKAFFSKSDISELFELTDGYGRDEMPTGGRIDLNRARVPEREDGEVEEHKDDTTTTSRASNRNNSSSTDNNSSSARVKYSAYLPPPPPISRQDPQSLDSLGDIDDELNFDVQPFVEQEIPQELEEGGSEYQEQQEGNSGDVNGSNTNGSAESKDADSSTRDKKLLKVLYDGAAISSVYDHHFLEPGQEVDPNGAQGRLENHVNNAVRNLQRSAPSYDRGGIQPVARSRNAPMAVVAPANRFGSSSSAQQGGLSSSSILARLRANAPSSSSSSSSSFRQQSNGGSNSNSNSNSNNNSNSGSSTTTASRRNGTSSSTSAPVTSLQDDIAARLTTLFTESARLNRNAKIGLRSDFILGRFKDIGDHYAPTFRDVLRTVADLKNGKWYLKR